VANHRVPGQCGGVAAEAVVLGVGDQSGADGVEIDVRGDGLESDG